MSGTTSPTFEALRDALARTGPATSQTERNVEWVDPGHMLAFSRDPAGQLELFLVGGPLHATNRAVGERLVHDVWESSSGASLAASRLRLPVGSHFDAAAATVLIELLSNGYASTPQVALARTEPLIALVLTQGSAANAALTGLAGELFFVAALLEAAPRQNADVLLESWAGWRRSSRDIQLGEVGVEVKTTTVTASRHHIQGWYQIEPGVPVGAEIETALYLLSIGVQWSTEGWEGSGLTIEGLVHRVRNVVSPSAGDAFVRNVREYAGGLLLDDDGTAGTTSSRRPFTVQFERLYDLADDRIHLLHSADLARFREVVSDSVTFEIELDDRVRGDRNPISGMASIVSFLLERARQ